MPTEIIYAETQLGRLKNKKLLWDTLSDFSNYPEFIDSVTSVKVLERNDLEGKSQWSVSLEGAPLNWVEKDRFAPDQLTIQFEMLDGDFDEFSGQWKVEEKNGQLVLSLTLEYRLGIPVIEVALGGVLPQKFQGFATHLLESLSRKIQGFGPDVLEEPTPAYVGEKRQKTEKIAVYEIEESRKKSAGAA